MSSIKKILFKKIIVDTNTLLSILFGAHAKRPVIARSICPSALPGCGVGVLTQIRGFASDWKLYDSRTIYMGRSRTSS